MKTKLTKEQVQKIKEQKQSKVDAKEIVYKDGYSENKGRTRK